VANCSANHALQDGPANKQTANVPIVVELTSKISNLFSAKPCKECIKISISNVKMRSAKKYAV